MTICDKIRTVGDTLETNLNARGVSCTFGTGTGEKTILDMVNLITSSNLKGSSDAVISISASRPYLLSGEKTDLIVRLADGLGQPLANKSVSISDGTSVYNGITNNNGLFTLYDVEVSADTTFTATYGTVSATCIVEYCEWVDYFTNENHQPNASWFLSSLENLSRTRNSNGTTVTKTESNNTWRYLFYDDSTLSTTKIGNRYSIPLPCIIEFDVTGITNKPRIDLMSDTVNTPITKEIQDMAHYKVVLNQSTCVIYQNSTSIYDGAFTGSNIRFGFSFDAYNESITLRNFRIRAL